MERIECQNCGLMFKPFAPKEIFCAPCELAIRAVEPPQHLRDMQTVYSGQLPTSAGEVQMKLLLEKDVGGFLDRMNRFDDQYRKAIALRPAERKVIEAPVWDGRGPCPTCKRAEVVADASVEACLRKAEQWLEQRSSAAIAEDGSS